MSDKLCRSCGAPIVWALTVNGRRIPLDRDAGPNPNIVVDNEGIANVVTPGEGDRTSHFATCPDGGQHRKARR